MTTPAQVVKGWMPQHDLNGLAESPGLWEATATNRREFFAEDEPRFPTASVLILRLTDTGEIPEEWVERVARTMFGEMLQYPISEAPAGNRHHWMQAARAALRSLLPPAPQQETTP